MLRIFLKVLYWVAVLAIALALVIGLILWFESRDQSEVEGASVPGQVGARPGAV
jgi:cytochrome b subunit of formate dehydrogenase